MVRHHEVGRVTGREVQRRLENTLSYNELTWQRFSGVQYHCARRAEYLEMVLFQCPHCRAFGTIVSHRDTVTCTSCGNKASYTPSGRIRWFGGHDGPDTVYAWNMLQIKDLKERARLNDHPETALAWAAQVHVFRGNRLRPLLFLGEADVTVHIGGISFEWTKQARNQRSTTPLPQQFSIDTIVGIHVQMARDLEFYADGRLYLVRPTSPRTSSFWLEEALKQAQTAANAKQSNHRSE